MTMKLWHECDTGVTMLALQWQRCGVKIEEVFVLMIAMVQHHRFLSEMMMMMNGKETHPPTITSCNANIQCSTKIGPPQTSVHNQRQ